MAELLTNGGFESGVAEYGAGGSGALSQVSSPTPAVGSHCARVAIPTGASGGTIYREVLVAPGTANTWAFQTWLSAADGGVLRYTVTRMDTGEIVTTGTVAGAGGWVAESVSFTAPGSGSGVTLRYEIGLGIYIGATVYEFFTDEWAVDGTAGSGGGGGAVSPEPLDDERGEGRGVIVWLYDSAGTRQALLHRLASVTWTHVVCGVGRFEIVLPNVLDFEVGDSTIVEIRRRLQVGTSYLEFVGLVDEVERIKIARARRDPDDDGAAGESETGELLRLAGTDLNGLLARRQIPIAAAASGGTLTGAVGDVMKAVVRRHLGPGAETARQLPVGMFTVAADAGDGPTTTRTVALRSVYDVLRELWEFSRAEGEEVFFEVYPTTATQWQFRTATGQLRRDQRQSLRFGAAYRNVAEPGLLRLYGERANVVYYSYGAAEVAQGSPTGLTRREGYEDVRSEATGAGAGALAKAALDRQAPRARFQATLADAPNARYGVWRCGDRIRAYEFGRLWDAVITAVTVTVSEGGQETIQARIEAEA